MRETWWLARDARSVLAAHDLPLSVAGMMERSRKGRLLSSDRQSAAVLLEGGETLEAVGTPLLLKWRAPRRGRRWRTFLRASRERREARFLLRVAERGISVPAALAVGERRHGGRLVGSVLVRRYLPEHVPGDVALRRDASGPLEARLAAALADWHGAGVRHGDCYPKNVLVSPDGAEVVPIGAPAARWRRPGRRLDRWRRRDLAQWAAGCRDLFGADDEAFRFLAAYARAAGLGTEADTIRRLQARIQAAYARILARKARRIATRPTREPEGPPAPSPLPPEPAGTTVPRALRNLGL